MLTAGLWLRLFHPRIPSIVNMLLCGCLSLGLLLFYGSAEEMVLRPTATQRQYLGKAYGTPLNLSHHRHLPHIMDPWSEWRYALAPSAAAELRQRCRNPIAGRAERGCSLVSAGDERWMLSISLSDRDELRIEEGLW